MAPASRVYDLFAEYRIAHIPPSLLRGHLFLICWQVLVTLQASLHAYDGSAGACVSGCARALRSLVNAIRC